MNYLTIEEIFARAAATYRQECRDAGCINIGELLAFLNELPQDALLKINNNHGVDTVSSYRGDYRRLALNKSSEPITVGNLARYLSDIIGSTIPRYKGGEFTVDENALLHCADHGEFGPMITGVTITDAASVLLETKEAPGRS